jgi:hypothetical protein
MKERLIHFYNQINNYGTHPYEPCETRKSGNHVTPPRENIEFSSDNTGKYHEINQVDPVF